MHVMEGEIYQRKIQAPKSKTNDNAMAKKTRNDKDTNISMQIAT